MTPLTRPKILAAGLLLALLAGLSPTLCRADDTDWVLVFDALRRQDTVIHERLNVYKARESVDARTRSAALDRLTREQARLALWQATANDPWELRNVLAGLAKLHQEVERLAKQPQQAWASLEEGKASLENFKDRLTEISQQNLPEQFRQEVLPYRESIKALGVELATLSDTIAAETTPLRTLADQVRAAEDAAQSSLTPAWEAYYAERFPSVFSLHFLETFRQNMEDWQHWLSLCQELLRTEHNKGLVRSGLGWSVLSTVLSACLLFAIIQLLRRRGLAVVKYRLLVKAGSCLVVGVFFFTLSQHAPFLLYSSLSSVGEMLLAAALVHLARLSKTVGEAAKSPPVLWPTWRIFALGLFLEGNQIPEVITTPVMTIVLLVAAVAFHKRYTSTPVALTLDRAITGGLRLLLPGLAILAFIGLPQTAILGASALFYLGLALRLAATTTRFLGQREVARHHGNPSVLLGLLAGAGYPFFFLFYLVLLLWLLSTQFGGENVFAKLITTEAHIESVGISLKKLAAILAGYYATGAIIALTTRFIEEMVGRRRAVERGAKASLLTLNSYVWWGGYLLFSMSVLGLSLTSVAVVAGGLSVGIGFGLQTLVNNFIGGLILLFGRSIRAGDTIQLPDGLGVVQEVNIRNTEVRTVENATVFVPNAELVSGRITNWSHDNPSVRRDVAVGVAYGSDIETVRRLLLEAAGACAAVLPTPPPTVLHWDFGPSSLDFRVRVWIKDIDDAVTAMSEIRENIDRLFRAAGIEIAFPQADVHLRSAPALDPLLGPTVEELRRQLTAINDRLTALEQKTVLDDSPKDDRVKDIPHDA